MPAGIRERRHQRGRREVEAVGAAVAPVDDDAVVLDARPAGDVVERRVASEHDDQIEKRVTVEIRELHLVRSSQPAAELDDRGAELLRGAGVADEQVGRGRRALAEAARAADAEDVVEAVAADVARGEQRAERVGIELQGRVAAEDVAQVDGVGVLGVELRLAGAGHHPQARRRERQHVGGVVGAVEAADQHAARAVGTPPDSASTDGDSSRRCALPMRKASERSSRPSSVNEANDCTTRSLIMSMFSSPVMMRMGSMNSM